MPTPAYIAGKVAALMNDTKRRYYTNGAVLPYLNDVLDELQEIYQENDIPVVEETSNVITVPAGVTVVSFTSTPPLPSDLIEIKRLWESASGQNKWTPMTKKEFLPHYMEGTAAVSKFIVWSEIDNQINVLVADQPNDLKIDYVKKIFNTPILIEQMNAELGAKFVNISSYLSRRTAALCAMFIGENETRAAALNSLADLSLHRALQIPIKGKQSIVTIRRPFRANYKTRSVY